MTHIESTTNGNTAQLRKLVLQFMGYEDAYNHAECFNYGLPSTLGIFEVQGLLSFGEPSTPTSRCIRVNLHLHLPSSCILFGSSSRGPFRIAHAYVSKYDPHTFELVLSNLCIVNYSNHFCPNTLPRIAMHLS